MLGKIMEFTKMHGLGNDFVVLHRDNDEPDSVWSNLAERMCHRHFGIGADGLVIILPSLEGDFLMRIFNSDGSEPEMCGNAIRCVAKYLYDRQLIQKKTMRIQTLAGVKIIDVEVCNDEVASVKVNMGNPILSPEEIPVAYSGDLGSVVNEKLHVEDEELAITCVSMGNPHAVIFADIDDNYLKQMGPNIEEHNYFPEKTNVEFVKVISPQEIDVKVWERGAGVTLACGTGACATVVASILNDYVDRDKKILVHLPGGDLNIYWDKTGDVYMEGPAEEVFTGKFKT